MVGTFSPLLTANVYITRHETFNSMYYPQHSKVLGKIGSAWAERVGQGEVGWYTHRVKTAWPCMGWLWKSLS